MKNTRQITVFGANGRIGRLVVAALLKSNLTVIAAVHGQHQFDSNSNLKIVTADIYDPKSVDQAILGSDAVISTLGSWGTKRQDVLTAGMANIISSMQRQSISRIISLTGAESRAPGDKLGLIHRMMHLALGIAAPKILRDGENHIKLLAASDLKWTVVRSPIMTDRRTGQAKLSFKRPFPWALISRDFVVAAIVKCAHDESWSKQAPFII